MKDNRFSVKRFGILAALVVLILLLILCISMCGRQEETVPAPETTAETTVPVVIRTATEATVVTTEVTVVPTEETEPPTDPTAAPTTLPKEEEDEDSEEEEIEEDIDIPDPGSPENPYVEVVGAYPADVESVYLAAETEVSYLIAGSAGSVITIADPGVTLTVDDAVYTADESTGVLTVDLSKLGMDPIVTLKNVSAATANCLVTLNEGIGGAGNPEILTDPVEIAVSLMPGDANGYHYQWTATTDGTVELKLKEAPVPEESAQAAAEETEPTEPAEEPVILEIVVTVGEETFRLTDVEAGVLAFDVEKDTQVLIQVITVPREDGYYPDIEETVLWKLLPALGTIENPQLLEDIGEIAVSLKENDKDGFHYLWTADREGFLTLTPDEGIAVTASVEGTAAAAAEGESKVSAQIEKEQQVLIQAVAVPVPQETEAAPEDTETPEDEETQTQETSEEPVMTWPAVTGKIVGLVTSLPGAPDNPVILESLDAVAVALAEGDTDGYTCQWLAPLEGTLTLRYEATDTPLEVRVTGPDGTEQILEQELVLNVQAEDAVTILVTAIPDESGSYPAGDVALTGSFAAAPGVSPENPIVLTDPAEATTVAMEARQTLYFSGMVHEMIATVEDANGVSIHHEGKTAWGSQTGTAAMEFPEADGENPEAPVLFSVTSKNEKELTLAFAYPAGHAQNPAQLLLGENKLQLKEQDEDGYLFVWTAPCDGFLTVALEEKALWQYRLDNLTTGQEGALYTSVQEPLPAQQTLEVKQGDRLQLTVKTLDPKDPEILPAGNLKVFASFFDPLLGTEAKPISLNSEQKVINTITVPAGQTLYYGAKVEGMILAFTGRNVTLTSSGTEYATEEGKLELLCNGAESVFVITNTGEKDETCTLTFTYPPGHRENPLPLEMGENTAQLEEGNISGCAFAWAAETAGQLTVSMAEDAQWQFVLINKTAGTEGVIHTSEDDPEQNRETLEVAAGDQVLLIVNTFDPAHPLHTPAGEVRFTAEYVDPTLGEAENPIWLNLTDTVTVPAGKTMYCTAKADGMLLTLEGADVTVNHNGVEYLPKKNQVTILCHGEGLFGHPVFEITNTGKEDREYTISFAYPDGHFMNPTELILGENTATPEPDGKHGHYFLWTADRDGTLTITMKTEEGWIYCVSNLTAGEMGQEHSWDEEEPVSAQTVTVHKGDEIRIVVRADSVPETESTGILFAAAAEDESIDQS